MVTWLKAGGDLWSRHPPILCPSMCWMRWEQKNGGPEERKTEKGVCVPQQLSCVLCANLSWKPGIMWTDQLNCSFLSSCLLVRRDYDNWIWTNCTALNFPWYRKPGTMLYHGSAERTHWFSTAVILIIWAAVDKWHWQEWGFKYQKESRITDQNGWMELCASVWCSNLIFGGCCHN